MAGRGASLSGLQQKEKELEEVLEALRLHPNGSITEVGGGLPSGFGWMLNVWDTALGKSGLIISIGRSFLDRIQSTRSIEVRGKIARATYLCLSPLQFFFIGLEELINDVFRDTVTRCGMCCERIVNELLGELGDLDLLEPNVKFVNKVGALQHELSLLGYHSAQSLCTSMTNVYEIRNQRGPHDVPCADELEAKFSVTSIPLIYARYLEFIQMLGYDLFGNADKLVELCNSIVEVRTTLAVKPGNLAYGVQEAIEILLYKNGFFAQQKSLAEVIVELGAVGYNYPKPSVANALEGLTRKFLSRSGKPGAFRYHQKIPPTEYYKAST